MSPVRTSPSHFLSPPTLDPSEARPPASREAQAVEDFYQAWLVGPSGPAAASLSPEESASEEGILGQEEIEVLDFLTNPSAVFISTDID